MGALTLEAWIGAIVIVVALAGGAWGTLSCIRSAQGRRERAFVVRACLTMWALVAALLAAVAVLPSPWRYAVLLAFFIAAPILIYRMATVHQLIRLLEQRGPGEPGRDQNSPPQA